MHQLNAAFTRLFKCCAKVYEHWSGCQCVDCQGMCLMRTDMTRIDHLGCRYFLAPRNEIISGLEQSQQSMVSNINDLNAKRAAVENSLKGVESELRELLTSSPALAQQLAAQEA